MSDLLKSISGIPNHLEEMEYALKDIQKNFTLYETLDLISDHLIVIYKWDDVWLKWCFLEWAGGDMRGNDTFTPFMYGEGPSGSLRECRHTHIGEEGYVFYLNGQRMKQAIEWLEQHYDMN